MLTLITNYRDGRGPIWLYRILMWCVDPGTMWVLRGVKATIVRSPCGRIAVKYHQNTWCYYHDAIEATDETS